MSPPATPPPPPVAVRYGSRDASTAEQQRRRCPVCTTPTRSTRAAYCSDACKQRAYRLRRPGPPSVDPTPPVAARTRRPASTIYECSTCGERLLGEWRCPECNRFCRALGPGGPCPHCDEPVLLADLLPEGGATISNTPD
jgi:hypothetical protein